VWEGALQLSHSNTLVLLHAATRTDFVLSFVELILALEITKDMHIITLTNNTLVAIDELEGG
jgi:hypothetical protein